MSDIVNKLISKLDFQLLKGVNKKTLGEKEVLPIFGSEDVVFAICSKNIEENQEYLNYYFDKKIEIKAVSKESFKEILSKIILEEDSEAYQEIIKEAISKRASDIHFEPENKEIGLIRIRVDGVLHIFRKMRINIYQKIISQVKIRANMDITEKRRPQDGKFQINYDGESYDLRVSSIEVANGEKIVIRVLYCNNLNYTIEDLNLTKTQRGHLKKIIDQNNGLVIVNGPTGSGKSTTLYTILKEINKESINITTIEDPVEVFIKGINQMTVNKKAKIDFACGLRSILRQDPDVIMVGEIRDEETANIVVSASLTGHKVYSTIHCKTPREVYFRFEDMGVKKYLIKDSLIGIISQRLIKKLCENCKEVKGRISSKNTNIEHYHSNGCDKCNYTGYLGRKGVYSINYIDNKVRENIKGLNDNIGFLDNSQMIVSLMSLLRNGDISLKDYYEFLLKEGMEVELS